MKKILIYSFVFVGLVLISSFSSVKNEPATVKWMTFEEAVEKARKEKKKIFVDVYTVWCGPCKMMDKYTFSDPEVAKVLNEKFYPVKLNAEQREDIIYDGHTFRYIENARGRYHELAASLVKNNLAYPTSVFLTEDFEIIQPLPGYQKPEQFHKIVTYFGEDFYKSKSWDDFQKEDYKSPYVNK